MRRARCKKPSLRQALQRLNADMQALEQHHHERLTAGDAASAVDRDTAEQGLARVVDFFLDHRLESQPIYRLLGALAALSAGASPPAMLRPAKTRHRRPDAPATEIVKGRLAAIMAYRQRSGLSRKAASTWVARNTPAKMQQRLGANSSAAVDHWLLKWGGTRGATPGAGRESYLAMTTLLHKLKPDEARLKRIIGALAKSLAS